MYLLDQTFTQYSRWGRTIDLKRGAMMILVKFSRFFYSLPPPHRPNSIPFLSLVGGERQASVWSSSLVHPSHSWQYLKVSATKGLFSKKTLFSVYNVFLLAVRGYLLVSEYVDYVKIGTVLYSNVYEFTISCIFNYGNFMNNRFIRINLRGEW